MYTKQLVHWHLINMGSPKDFQTIHFHGQTFLHKKTTNYRQAVHPLLPGTCSGCYICCRVDIFISSVVMTMGCQLLQRAKLVLICSNSQQEALQHLRCIRPSPVFGSWRQKLVSTKTRACRPYSWL